MAPYPLSLGSGADACMDQFNCSRELGGRGKECIPSGEDVYMYIRWSVHGFQVVLNCLNYQVPQWPL